MPRSQIFNTRYLLTAARLITSNMLAAAQFNASHGSTTKGGAQGNLGRHPVGLGLTEITKNIRAHVFGARHITASTWLVPSGLRATAHHGAGNHLTLGGFACTHFPGGILRATHRGILRRANSSTGRTLSLFSLTLSATLRAQRLSQLTTGNLRIGRAHGLRSGHPTGVQSRLAASRHRLAARQCSHSTVVRSTGLHGRTPLYGALRFTRPGAICRHLGHLVATAVSLTATTAVRRRLFRPCFRHHLPFQLRTTHSITTAHPTLAMCRHRLTTSNHHSTTAAHADSRRLSCGSGSRWPPAGCAFISTTFLSSRSGRWHPHAILTAHSALATRRHCPAAGHGSRTPHRTRSVRASSRFCTCCGNRAVNRRLATSDQGLPPCECSLASAADCVDSLCHRKPRHIVCCVRTLSVAAP